MGGDTLPSIGNIYNMITVNLEALASLVNIPAQNIGAPEVSVNCSLGVKNNGVVAPVLSEFNLRYFCMGEVDPWVYYSVFTDIIRPPLLLGFILSFLPMDPYFWILN